MDPPGRSSPPRPSTPTSAEGTGGRIVALATDLDRTLLTPGGSPTATARRALRAARSMGVATLLVSGRRHSELREFARAFGALDGLVAEDGAVIEAPLGSPPRILGRRLGTEVRRRTEHRPGLHGEFGTVVGSFLGVERRRLRAAIRGLPVDIVTNRDRVMVLPRGVTKRSGTRSAIRRIGLGRGAYAAIGDAENDLDLLAGASLAGAVANAVPAVCRAADYVCRGRCEAGVLEFVIGPVAGRRGFPNPARRR
jgi:hydroxymethylpyrimidine pyrophosphatase-like HAD family hydrolase